MFRLAVFLSLLALVASQDSTPSIRFINAIEGSTLTFYTDFNSDGVTVAYQQASQFFDIPAGTIKINNVLDSNGNSLNNGNPIQTSFGTYNTLIALNYVAQGNSFTLVLINETNGATIDQNPDATKAYVRLVDLSQASSPQYITLAYTGGSIASYVGFLAPTSFVAIPASTTSLRVYDSQSGSYNNPSLTIPLTFTGQHAYSVFFFVSSQGVQSASVIDDRVVGAPGATTGVQSTTGAQQSTTGTQQSTTGSQQSTTGVAQTTGTTGAQSTSTGVIGTGANNNENSASKTAAFGLALLAVAALL